MSKLLDQLASWRPFTAIVVGDFMLDQLVFGNADRLSPEAPVPVLSVQRTEDRPGGAANVCLDLVAMKATVHALGVTGDDREADLLRSSLVAAGVNADALVSDATRPTTVKRSLIGLAQHRHPQKMFRVDHESREPLAVQVERQLCERFDALLAASGGADVVCIEDYNKGVCTPALCQHVIRAAKKARGGRGVPVLVDPAAIEDYSKYKGCSTVTPNRTEAALATGVELADDATPEEHGPLATQLLVALDLEAAVITLDRHGALLLEKGKPALGVPTVARQVYDVTGAGDMVLAALAGARANGISWADAVRFANAAAGLEVQVFGVVPMPIEKIHREVMMLEGAHAGMAGKVRTLEQLLVEVAAHRNDGKKIVFTNGCFDVLHAGHLSLLRRASDEGDFLIVGVNSDDSVRRLKGKKDPSRPINHEGDRAELLGGLECVDAVVVFDEDTPETLIQAIRPDAMVKGAEYSIAQVPGAVFVQSIGGRVVLLEMVEGKSTTAIVNRAREAQR